ncbi:MAG: MerR family transcriptional regulator [Eubacteriales bacterium]|nr:MerR family transcriptional regulator [Eubacteriales bacterium]
MKISEVEKRTGITSHNIRFYEKEGLINPPRNLSNGYREYTETDVERINCIKLLRMLDISIKDIKVCLEEEEKLSCILDKHLKDLKEEEYRIKQNIILCQEFADMGIDDLSADMIEKIICDKEAYVINLQKIKKQDKIQSLFFVSKQLLCIIGWLTTLIMTIWFYISLCLAYMDRPFQIITLLLAVLLFGCMFRIVYFNEKKN